MQKRVFCSLYIMNLIKIKTFCQTLSQVLCCFQLSQLSVDPGAWTGGVVYAAVGVHAGAETGRRARAEPQSAPAVRRLLAQWNSALPRGQQHHVHLWYVTKCTIT